MSNDVPIKRDVECDSCGKTADCYDFYGDILCEECASSTEAVQKTLAARMLTERRDRRKELAKDFLPAAITGAALLAGVWLFNAPAFDELVDGVVELAAAVLLPLAVCTLFVVAYAAVSVAVSALVDRLWP